jgi:hypothetical protein
MAYALRDAGSHQFVVGPMLRVGSDPINQIILRDTAVSPIHATLSESRGILYLRDENSANGTFVNQVRIRGLVQVPIGSQITFGGTTFSVDQAPDSSLPDSATLARKKPGGCLSLWPLAIYLVLFVLCLGIFGGTYWIYKYSPSTQQAVLALANVGPATIEMENVSDQTVFVYTTLDTKRQDKDSYGVFQWEMKPNGTNFKSDLNSSVYRIDFGSEAGGMDLGTCIFNLHSGQAFHFVMLPGNILVDRKDYPKILDHTPSSMNEFLVSKSSLCKYSSEQ